MRRCPRELTNRGGRVPAVAGNGGKPATRGENQRGRGSQLPAVNTRRPLAKRIRGSVGQVPMPKTSRYRQEVDEEVRKAYGKIWDGSVGDAQTTADRHFEKYKEHIVETPEAIASELEGKCDICCSSVRLVSNLFLLFR